MPSHSYLRLVLQLRSKISEYVGEVEEAYGRPLKPGRNHKIAFMAHLWEPLRYALHGSFASSLYLQAVFMMQKR